MKRTLIATMVGTALVAAGAYANEDAAKHQSQSGSTPQASSESMSSQSSPQASTQDSETVKKVQSALAQQGYDPGPVDGQLGSRTKSALKQAQKDKGIEATGQIDEQTIAALGANESGGSSMSNSGSSDSSTGSSTGSSDSTSGSGTSSSGASSSPGAEGSSSSESSSGSYSK